MPGWTRVLFQPSRYKFILGGRGSSKSWGVADALVMKASQKKLRILCAREVQLSIKDSSKRVIEDAIERHGLGSIFEVQQTKIVCTLTGSEFLFSGLRDGGDKLKSMEGIDIVWVEEASTVSRKSIETLHPTIRKPNSEIWYTFNPRFKTDPVYELAMNPPPDAIVLKVNFDDNPFFPDVLRDQMEWDKQNDYDKYRHIWLGEPVIHSEAQVFHGRWKVEPIPEPPNGTRFYFGADWGFAQDPTTFIRCWIDGRKLYIDRAVGGVGVEIDATPDLFRQIEGSEKWPITADCARPETISYMKRNGFSRMRGSKKGKNSIEDGVAFIRQFDVVIAPDLKDVQEEFALYSYKVDRHTDDILPIIEDKHNNYIDALRYAIEELMRRERSKGSGAVVIN